MGWNNWVLLGGATVLLSSMGLGAMGQAGKGTGGQGGGAEKPNLKQILAERSLWGKDFPTALGYLASLKEIGERKVAVYPRHFVVDTSHRRSEGARQDAARLEAALRKAQPKAKPGLEAIVKAAPGTEQPPPFKADVFLADDGKSHVALTNPQAQFLAPNLTVASVKERLGPPDQVTSEVVQTEKDERPAVLTHHFYAQRSVDFVESDIAPRPGLVSRVVLDVPAVSAELFQEHNP
jgi:hypothetical protein